MSIAPTTLATLDDLAKVSEKAELIGGRIVYLMPSGDAPNYSAFEIAVSLREYARRTGVGRAYTDGMGFTLSAPLTSGRLSFSPDAAYYTGSRPAVRLRFVEGVPDFAVEVRSENDYGRSAERELSEKRDDYFEAGTQIVWDVDTVAETIMSYSASDPSHPVCFRRGDIAHAEPAVPGWRMAVADVFESP